MNRSQYDGDITIFSPQGKIFQIEYAMEAVKQGSASVGLKSKDFAIVVGLKRASSELGAFQPKVFKIDDHIGIAVAGLIADARGLSKYMRSETLNYKFVYDSPMQVGRLVTQLSDKSQAHTQRYGRRPYGVGLLVVGYDQTGAHLYETSPSGVFYDFKAQAIGARSQSARTYLEKHYESFAECPLEDLIKHGLYALRETLPNTETLSTKNCTVGVVGLHKSFDIIEGERLKPYLDAIEETSGSTETTTTDAEMKD
eukprot:TRINITY_DN10868_c0_g1_i1.p1 TRINITY_DN10868_c0_g1~~TRINITY_DN10868_c0_g1_i1.p1  ORF type:complete len:255 (-),score=71.34 TRINITY_DN10868_c0_g1_i1:118-882(-)